jgi:hypothetical protein
MSTGQADEGEAIILFSAEDASAQAKAIVERLRADGCEVEHDEASAVSGKIWPLLTRLEQLLHSPATPTFLLSPGLTTALARNKSFSEAIYDVVARGRAVHVVMTDASQPLPTCFLSIAGVEIDHYLNSRPSGGQKRNKSTHRTDIRDIVQRKEPGRRATLLVPNSGASPNALGYEIIELSDPLNENDKSYIAAFVSEPFRIAAASADILQHYPAWKTARIKSAIVRKPRSDVRDTSAMLDHIARELQLDQKNVFYLDDYIRRKTAAFSQRTPQSSHAPVYVPVAARLKPLEGKPGIVHDTLQALDEWRSRPHCPVMLIGGEGGTGKTHVVREAHDRWNRTSVVRAHSIDSHTFIQKFETRLASNSPIEVYDIYLACGSDDDRDRLDKESFYDHWLNGTYLLTIDGVDEIANRAPGDFSLVEFLEDVLLADTEGFGKLLVTAREFLLTEELTSKVELCQLLPFDERRATSFFEKTYKRDLSENYALSFARLVERSLKDATALRRGESGYIPYVLSLIAESYMESDTGDANLSFSEESDLECANLTEFVVNRICQRERLRIRDPRIRVEEQRVLLELLSAEGAPGVTEDRYRRLIKQVIEGGVSENIERFLLSHLLLARRSVEGANTHLVWFRYDFHAEHFLASLVARHIRANVESVASDSAKAFPSKPSAALVDHRGFDDLLVTGVAEQLMSLPYDDMVQGVLATMQTTQDLERETKRYLDAALFNIALKKEVMERGDSANCEDIMSSLAKDLFGGGGGLRDISISRIPRQPHRRMTLNLMNTTVQNGYFEDWHDFFHCRANESTRFEQCVVSRCGADLRGHSSLTEQMFDRSTCSLDDLAQARLLSASASVRTKEEAVRESLRRFFAAFRSGVGTYRAHAGKNWFGGRGYASMQAANLLSAEKFASVLLRSGIITESNDRRGGHYALNPDYHVDVADFVEQARESKALRGAMKALVAAAR